MIVPPGSLEVVNTRSTMRRRLRLKKINPPEWVNWNPLIIVGLYTKKKKEKKPI